MKIILQFLKDGFLKNRSKSQTFLEYIFFSKAAPEGRRLRPEEHWRPAQGRDLSKYKPRAAMVDAKGDDLMKKINRVAAEMRANASPTNKKDLGKEALPTCGIEGPAKAKEGRIVGGVEAEEHAWPWQVDLSLSLCICICICSSST